jgi:pilus assembly protein CpaC
LLGLDILSALDLAENDGRVHTLAEPNLTALSGETASFLAGGEFPIPMANGLSGTSIEFKQYGVSLAFTPTVLEGGRISMRVRPEVSELSNEGAIQINGFTIPSLTTRRAETTVELGSGQSFMIGGLLRNSSGNTMNKAPILGSLPIIGALFRSNAFKRNETELVIVVTPYLVRPVNASQIALPTDGYRSANTAERVLLGTSEYNQAGALRPQPHMASPQAAPGVGPVTGEATPQPASPAPQRQAQQQPQQAVRPQQASAAPGFSF